MCYEDLLTTLQLLTMLSAYPSFQYCSNAYNFHTSAKILFFNFSSSFSFTFHREVVQLLPESSFNATIRLRTIVSSVLSESIAYE